jgi:hypothetical protein
VSQKKGLKVEIRANGDGGLEGRARAVLAGNDAGGWTKAAPNLYPHQWSWDSAFIAIGWSHLDVLRALQEMERLFARQWRTGMVPHIVFDDRTPPGAYFPDWLRWDADRSGSAPAGPPYTSGLCQPPVHAIAMLRIWEVAQGSDEEIREEVRQRLARLYPAVVSWHRYLAAVRDPEGSGLVTIYHPWEGTDNSPRWDSALSRIVPGDMPPYHRRDVGHVADPSQRPADADYDRYMWLVELLKRHRYDDKAIQKDYPFLVKDVFFTAVLVAANAALLRIGEAIGATDESRGVITEWIAAGRRGLDQQWDHQLDLCLDFDLRNGSDIPVITFAGLAPLVPGEENPERRAALLQRLDSRDFTGHKSLRWRVVPSTSPHEPFFEPRNYWRGPTWPIIDWVIWRGLKQQGDDARADQLRRAALQRASEAGFGEYFEPFTGEALGSPDQSWTAAVVLDWLEEDRYSPAAAATVRS